MESKYTLENLVSVPVRCKHCQTESEMATFNFMLEDETTPLAQTLKKDGYVSVDCFENNEEDCETKKKDNR